VPTIIINNYVLFGTKGTTRDAVKKTDSEDAYTIIRSILAVLPATLLVNLAARSIILFCP